MTWTHCRYPSSRHQRAVFADHAAALSTMSATLCYPQRMHNFLSICHVGQLAHLILFWVCHRHHTSSGRAASLKKKSRFEKMSDPQVTSSRIGHQIAHLAPLIFHLIRCQSGKNIYTTTLMQHANRKHTQDHMFVINQTDPLACHVHMQNDHERGDDVKQATALKLDPLLTLQCTVSPACTIVSMAGSIAELLALRSIFRYTQSALSFLVSFGPCRNERPCVKLLLLRCCWELSQLQLAWKL